MVVGIPGFGFKTKSRILSFEVHFQILADLEPLKLLRSGDPYIFGWFGGFHHEFFRPTDLGEERSQGGLSPFSLAQGHLKLPKTKRFSAASRILGAKDLRIPPSLSCFVVIMSSKFQKEGKLCVGPFLNPPPFLGRHYIVETPIL